MGRKRVHPSDADKQKAYRDRKKTTGDKTPDASSSGAAARATAAPGGDVSCRIANRHRAYSATRPCPVCGFPNE